MSTQALHSHQDGESTVRPDLPNPEDLTAGLLHWRSICKTSCEQSDDGKCTGRLDPSAAGLYGQLRDPKTTLDDYGSILRPVLEVARSIYLDSPVAETDQEEANRSINQLALGLHHNESYRNTLVEGERSTALTEWTGEFVKRYTDMRSEATCHTTKAKNNQTTAKSMKSEAESNRKTGDPELLREAARLDGYAEELEAKMRKKANTFMEYHHDSLIQHCYTLPDVYSKETPKGPEPRAWAISPEGQDLKKRRRQARHATSQGTSKDDETV